MYALSKRLTDAYSRRFARAVRETYREDEAYASTPLGRLALWAFLLLLLLLPFLLGPYPMYVATLVAIGALSALGLHLLVGGAGQISLGHAAFMGVGAYAASHLFGPLAPLGILLGGLIAALLGLVLALPSLRIKGVYLAIATLAFQFLADYVFKNWEAVTGGIRGRTLPPPQVLGLSLDTPERLWYLVLLFALPLFFYGKRLLMTRAGRAFNAVRDNDLSARVAGVDLTRVKLFAFALSAFYAGVAGGLLAQLYKAVTPEYFPLSVSIQYLAMVIVGGAGTVLGAVLGAFFVLLIPEVLNSFVGALGPEYAATLAAWRNVAFGLLILLFLILEPLGLVGLWGRIRNYFRTWPLPY
ncbi:MULTISPECIES: branched-chain amino acid ABC transporter permease [Thermus]|uniref:Branched-chain amino acid ABC transporter permease n=1 Tax=Thermus brockianus TaxID=56956 RepID=A0A1J0LQ46_THEBO|nr:branched-chain amino acid ABC transporter permease [Thermus brockianus]APD08441.1 branched-chain amino acid ABC transporter permease [Thermus brockianus]BDG16210.1 branched-chain amino acid ABC transporter permease [Thermus brockianus]